MAYYIVKRFLAITNVNRTNYVHSCYCIIDLIVGQLTEIKRSQHPGQKGSILNTPITKAIKYEMRTAGGANRCT